MVLNFLALIVILALSSTASSQLLAVLDTFDSALKLISTAYPRDPSKPYPYSLIVFDGFNELVQSIDDATGTDKQKGQALLNILLKWVVETNQVCFYLYFYNN